MKEKPQSSPLLLYSWDETWKALDALRDHEGSAFDGISLEYRHPQTGGPTIFIYDGHPGGVGITRRGYDEFERLAGPLSEQNLSRELLRRLQAPR